MNLRMQSQIFKGTSSPSLPFAGPVTSVTLLCYLSFSSVFPASMISSLFINHVAKMLKLGFWEHGLFDFCFSLRSQRWSFFFFFLNIRVVKMNAVAVDSFEYFVTILIVLQVPGAQDLVDFSPVYRCLHIYSVLVSFLDGSAQQRYILNSNSAFSFLINFLFIIKSKERTTYFRSIIKTSFILASFMFAM